MVFRKELFTKKKEKKEPKPPVSPIQTHSYIPKPVILSTPTPQNSPSSNMPQYNVTTNASGQTKYTFPINVGNIKRKASCDAILVNNQLSLDNCELEDDPTLTNDLNSSSPTPTSPPVTPISNQKPPSYSPTIKTAIKKQSPPPKIVEPSEDEPEEESDDDSSEENDGDEL